MPRVSVIVPVYNALPYLSECLGSILAQTLEDIEILCVDDGSTDGSLEVLDDYAARDMRLTVIRQENAGAGAARNTGLLVSRGEYLSFLDADDFFEPSMLEEAYQKCVEDDADICVYGARRFDVSTGEFVRADWLLRSAQLPDSTPFSYEDMLDHILVFVSPAPWNKMFRREFVTGEKLRFQEVKRANDLFFTRLALIKAQRITVVDKILVNYRVGSGDNLQASNHETPLEFYRALLALKREFVALGVFAKIERSFVNDALSNCLYNLNSLQTSDAFCNLYRLLKSGLFAELGIADRPRSFFFAKHHYVQYEKIMQLSPEAYLLDQVESLGRQLGEASNRLASADARLAKDNAKVSRVRESRSFRLGKRIRDVYHRIGTMVTMRRKAG